MVFGQQKKEELLSNIEAIGDVANVDNVLSIIKTEIQSLHPKAIMFNKDTSYPTSDYKFDESVDCVFQIFDLTNDIQDLLPIIAKELDLQFSEETQVKLYKAVESAVYILCEPDDADDDKEEPTDIAGFTQWIGMEDKKLRATIEKIIIKKMKKAFKLKLSKKEKKKYAEDKHGTVLYKKCLAKLKPNRIRGLYKKLRKKYPKQRGFMDMITGIFMYSCSRKYATKEAVQEFMQKIVSLDDADQFFNYLAEYMEPALAESNDNDECISKTTELPYLLEKYLLTKYPEFKQYPVWNAMNGLVEIGCAKKFVFEEDEGLPNMEDIPNLPDDFQGHPEL